MDQLDERAIPVVQDEQLVGMVYVEDLRDVDRSAWDTTTVKQVMVTENEHEVVTPRDDAMDAFQKLTRRGMRQIPIRFLAPGERDSGVAIV